MSKKEFNGGSTSYYTVEVAKPASLGAPYEAECLDIIEALEMSFIEGEAFKAIWRSCASRSLGKSKKRQTALYDAEKVVFYAKRMVRKARG